MRWLLYIILALTLLFCSRSKPKPPQENAQYWHQKISLHYNQPDSFIFWMDKLHLKSEKQKDTELKAKWHNHWGNFYRFHQNPDKSIYHYRNAMSLAQKIKNKQLVSYSSFNIGKLHKTFLSKDSALHYFQKALKLDKEREDSTDIATDLISIGTTHYSNGNLKNATIALIQALQIQTQLGNPMSIAIINNNLGLIFDNIENYDKAYSYYKKAEIIFKQLNKNKQRAKTLNNMGTMALRLNNYSKAYSLLNQSLELKKALGDTFSLASTYRNIGLTHQYQKEYSKALFNYRRSLQLSKVANNLVGEASALLSIGDIHNFKTQKDSALYYYQLAEAKSTSLNDFHLNHSIAQAMIGLNAELNNYQQALEYSLWSKELSDSLQNADKINQITGIEMNYQFDQYKIEQQLILQKNKLRIRQQLFTIGFIIVALFTALILIVFLYRNNQFKKRTIQKLQEANDKISAIFQNSMIGIAWVDSNRIIRRVNPYINSISGYTEKELVGQSMEMIYPTHEEYLRQGEILQQELQKNGHFELEKQMKRKDGSLAWVRGTGKLISYENSNLGVIWTLEDITQKRKNDIYLKLFKQLADNSQLGISINTLDGEIVYANPYLTRLLPAGTNNIIDNYPKKLQKRVENEIIPSVFEKGQWTGELQQSGCEDKCIHTIEHIFVIRDHKDNPVYLANIMTDITEKQEVEKLLRQSNKTQNLMLSVISHDIRGPLGAIHQLASILDQNIHELHKDELCDFIHQVKEHTGKAYNLLEDMLLWAKNQTGALPFNPIRLLPQALIEESVDLFQDVLADKQLQVKLFINYNDAIYADKDMLHSIIRNTLSNAIKFSSPESQIEIHTFKIEDQIHFKVIDYGVGIKPELIPTLLSPSSNHTSRGTHNEKGYGLGLKLCQQFIELHQGKIQISSKENEKTTIEFSIPITSKNINSN